MAGSSMTFSYDDVGTVKKITIDWVSDSLLGTVSGTTKKLSGFLLKGVTDPDGVAAPTANYDITLTDPEGGNILANCFDDLVDRHTANIESVDFIINDAQAGSAQRPCVADVITVGVAAAGNSKAGRLVLYWMGTPW
jgi:hypothetical protein